MHSAILFTALLTVGFHEPGCDAAHHACVETFADCCEHCGSCCPLIKVCRAECSEKEVTHTKYRVECEDFCVPGRSCKFCCEDACGCCQVCKAGTCGKVRTKKKLVKIEVKEKVPVTKCVVEYLCPGCCDACGADSNDRSEASVSDQDAVVPLPHEAPSAQPPAPAPAMPLPPTARNVPRRPTPTESRWPVQPVSRGTPSRLWR